MRTNKKGIILVASLWILAILSILAIGIGFRVSMEARLSKYNMDRTRALYLAKAGLFKTQEVLARYTKGYDTVRECGISLTFDNKPEEVFVEKLGDGSFTVGYSEEGKDYYGMSDEDRKININTADYLVLLGLLGGNEEVAASIINWRGTEQMIKGAWDDYYKSLSPPYKCKHAPFVTIEELWLVKGMTRELFDSIRDYITVYGNPEGRININTTTRHVMSVLGLSEAVIGMIEQVRNGPDKIPGTKDDGFFSGNIVNQLALDLGSDDSNLLGKYFTTMSNYFRIESKGAVDRSKITCKIVCVVKKGSKKLESYREY